MISIKKAGKVEVYPSLELYGLSTDIDSLPTDKIDGYTILNASQFMTMDTGQVFMFDEENSRWLEI